jgi:putative FmdB family regulatory protein
MVIVNFNKGDYKMPIFEYKCNKCGRKTEVLEKSGSKSKHVCEKCGSSDMRKVFSGFSIGQADSSSPGGNGSCPTGTCKPY